jgi:hypothetical protein
MKLGLLVAAIAVAALSGCSSSDSSSSGKTGPVASTPLEGTIDGKPFEGKFARAQKGFGSSDDGEVSIDIFDKDVPCDSFEQTTEPYVLLSVPWKAGTARDFKFASKPEGQTATFVIQKDGKTDNVISVQGRVEIVDAPTEKGATGKLRLRATAEGNNVEGEVAVKVCE